MIYQENTVSRQPVCLHSVVSQLLTTYQSEAVRHQSFFINELPADLRINAEKNVLSTLIGNLMDITARLSKGDCIRIFAVQTDDAVTVYIQYTFTNTNYVVAPSFRALQALAGKIGGSVHFSGHNYSSPIAVSFPAFSKAA